MRGDDAYNILNKKIKNQSERIKETVNEYLKENPVQSGATEEQAQQIKQNTDDVASLKEDLSTKITKFYASSQGETHLADSDDGKIMDMMLYGKSEQKQYSGKNLLNPTLQTTIKNGVTCTANGDGTYTLNGTATATGIFTLHSNIDFTGQMRLCGGTSLVPLQYSNSSNFAYEDKGAGIIIEHFDSVTYPNALFNILIKTDNVYNNALVKPMFTTDLTATYDDFEPYTGGIPSPNPDYPQEIKSVVNPTMKVCGKNLLNYKETTITNSLDVAGIEFVENGFRIYTKKDMKYCSSMTYLDFSKLRIGETYTLSANLLIVKGVSRLTIRNRVNTIIAGSSNITESGTYKISFTLTDQMYYVSFFATFDTDVSGDVIVTNIQLEKNATPTAYEPYHEQTVTLPYTLNAIPVNSGGNVTIDGQQYIADYVDVERGKLVRMVDDVEAKNYIWDLYPGEINMPRRFGMNDTIRFNMPADIRIMSSHFKQIATNTRTDLSTWFQTYYIAITDMNEKWKNSEALIQWFSENNVHFYLPLKTPKEIDLTSEEIAAFKTLVTYYPTTNISVNSEQLDGYTVFNYPISMANGWNYVKKQLNDNRDYIYDMDMQSAEAYVNSEYAVALTELEV